MHCLLLADGLSYEQAVSYYFDILAPQQSPKVLLLVGAAQLFCNKPSRNIIAESRIRY